jgi:DNA repair protein RecO
MEGIILESIPFEDYHRIITFYTPEKGVLKIFIKNASRFAAKFSFLKPLCKVELILKAGKKDLYYLEEGHFIKNFLESINHFEQIEIGSILIKSLLATQYNNCASKEVYLLFEVFLSALSIVKNPENLLRCFQIKTLCHEGLIKLDEVESFILFSKEEKMQLVNLEKVKSLSALDDMKIGKTLGLKIQALFDEVT